MGFRLALVSAYPPSRRPLSEHTWHLVEALEANDRVAELFVLADRLPGAESFRHGKLRVMRCWSFGGVGFAITPARVARSLNVDAVWFNLHMTSTGNTRVSNLAGMIAPALCHAAGLTTLVTLHNMLGLTDLDATALNATAFDVWGAHLATRLLRAADSVCVHRPEYAELLGRRYGVRRARFVPLGTPGVPLRVPPDAERRGLLAFGHFGSNKRLELLIDGVSALARTRAGVHLFVAGCSSRHSPGYLERLQARHQGCGAITFRGYVPEAEVPALFQRAAASILPYATTTGMSSVALQSAMYGAAILASDTPLFRSLQKEGLKMTFFEWGSEHSLKQALTDLLDAPRERRVQDAHHNLEYCHRHRMDLIVDTYLDILESLSRARS